MINIFFLTTYLIYPNSQGAKEINIFVTDLLLWWQ